MPRKNWTTTRFVFLVILGVAALFVLTLAMPIEGWRTGRIENPPLDLVNGATLVSAPTRIWIDTDAACGASKRTDPDDCLAILWLADQGMEIVGVSTSYGNAASETVIQTVRALRDQIRANGAAAFPIWRGAAAPMAKINGDGEEVPAQEALRAALNEQPLSIVALGPLTNIAGAIAGRVELQRRVSRIVAVMGQRPGHLFHPAEGSGQGSLLGHGPIFRDLNFVKDPDAAAAVLEMPIPVSFIPYDAARSVEITQADLQALAKAGSEYAWGAENSRAWLDYWNEDMGRTGFYPFDWVAAAYVIAPDLFACANAKAWIGRKRFLGVFPSHNLLVDPELPEDAEVNSDVVYCLKSDPTLHDFLIEVGSKGLSRSKKEAAPFGSYDPRGSTPTGAAQ